MRLRRIFRGVDVEQRILDLAQILINKGVPQILAQCDGPQADHRISEVNRPVV